MQYQPVLLIDRPATEHHLVEQRYRCIGDIQLLEHIGQRHADALIDYEAPGAAIVVIEDIDRRLPEIGIFHLWHRQQEMMRQVHRVRRVAVSCVQCTENAAPVSCRARSMRQGSSN